MTRTWLALGARRGVTSFIDAIAVSITCRTPSQLEAA